MTNHPERLAQLHPHVIGDVVMAVALGACVVFGAQISTSDSPAPDNTWLVWTLACAGGATSLMARSHPRSALVATAAGAVTLIALGSLPSPLLLAPTMFALYWLAALTNSRMANCYGYTITIILVATGLCAAPLGSDFMLRSVGTVTWLLFPLALGSTSRFRRAYLESLQARAVHAERTQEEQTRLRVAEERMRIARELHDAVAHHLAVAHAQAGTAAHLASTRPDQAQQILNDLVGTTSSAMLELRATVGVLRRTDDDESYSLEPTPGLDRLPELVTACASAGLTVTTTVEGAARALSPAADLTAFRIIQEALTNATKHASDHNAEIVLTYSASRLTITVTNSGRQVPATAIGGGYGLMGMRERAHAIGGELQAGPRPTGGFQVSAALPLHPPSHFPKPASDPSEEEVR